MKLINIFLALMLSTGLAAAAAADWQPTKPITVVIGFSPGSGNELAFRAVSMQIQKANPNVNFIIELKPGADSVIGSNVVYDARPDGYTLGVPSYMSTFVTNDVWQTEIKKFKYDSFKSITSIGKSPLVFVANAKSKTNTIEELIKRVKTDQITFAGGAGAHRMAFEFFMEKADGNPDRVKFAPHQGPLQAVTSVAGDTGMEFGVMPITVALPLIQAGKVKPIGITGSRALAQLPGVKPIKVGGSFINIFAAWAVVLPPNTPEEIVGWYNKAFAAAIATPEVQKFYHDNLIFTESDELSPKGFDEAIRKLRQVWIPIAARMKM